MSLHEPLPQERVEEVEKSMRTCTSELEAVLSDAKKLLNSLLEQEWTTVSRKDGLTTMSSPMTNSSIRAFGAKATVRTLRSPLEILEKCMLFYTDPALTKEHLPFLHPYFPYYHSFLIRPPNLFTIHCRFASGAILVKDRDYLNIRDIVDDPSTNSAYFISCSVPETLASQEEYVSIWPKDKQCIRGHLTLYWVRVRRVNPTSCSFEYLSHSDPRGAIPAWVTNWKAKEEARILLRYCKVLQDWMAESPSETTTTPSSTMRKDESVVSEGATSAVAAIGESESEDEGERDKPDEDDDEGTFADHRRLEMPPRDFEDDEDESLRRRNVNGYNDQFRDFSADLDLPLSDEDSDEDSDDSENAGAGRGPEWQVDLDFDLPLDEEEDGPLAETRRSRLLEIPRSPPEDQMIPNQTEFDGEDDGSHTPDDRPSLVEMRPSTTRRRSRRLVPHDDDERYSRQLYSPSHPQIDDDEGLVDDDDAYAAREPEMFQSPRAHGRDFLEGLLNRSLRKNESLQDQIVLLQKEVELLREREVAALRSALQQSPIPRTPVVGSALNGSGSLPAGFGSPSAADDTPSSPFVELRKLEQKTFEVHSSTQRYLVFFFCVTLLVIVLLFKLY